MMLWECEGSNDVGWSLKEHATGLKDFFWLLLLHFVRSSEVLDETSLDDSILSTWICHCWIVLYHNVISRSHPLKNPELFNQDAIRLNLGYLSLYLV